MKRFNYIILTLLIIFLASPISAQSKRYEVKKPNSSGDYDSQIECFDNLEEAVSSAKEKSGYVVVDIQRKIGNGIVYMDTGIVITDPGKIDQYIIDFGDSGLKSYVSGGYDALYIDGDGTNVTIEIMGRKGEIQTKDDKAPIEQVELIPHNHIESIGGQSYYQISGEEFCHHIKSYKYSEESNSYEVRENKVLIGDGKDIPDGKYYSYNGRDFYNEYYDIKEAFTYDIYFNSLPLRSYSNYSAEELDSYINTCPDSDSKLRNTGEIFVSLEDKYGVNAAALLAMAIHESDWGRSKIAMDKNNLFGINAVDENPYGSADTFNSIESNIEYQAHIRMHEGYLDPTHFRYSGPNVGNKGAGMNVKYASDPYWGEKISGHLYRLDNYLGQKDTNKYAIGWTIGWDSSPSKAYIDENLTKEAYIIQGTYRPNSQRVPHILLNEKEKSYEAISIMPIISGEAVSKANWEKGMTIHLDKNDITHITGDPSKIGFVEDETYKTKFERIHGSNRIETAIEISRQRDFADTVIISNAETQIDALSATPLAGIYDCPILLDRADRVTQENLDEIERLGAKKIILIGGETVLSPDYKQELKNCGFEVERIAGSNRYETSALIADIIYSLLNPENTTAFLANGELAADALSIGPVAAKMGAPILLTDGKTLDPLVESILEEMTEIHILGGFKAISQEVEDQIIVQYQRHQGEDRYETSAIIGKTFFKELDNLYFARGDVLADGLAGGPEGARTNGPILLLRSYLGPEMKSYLNTIKDTNNYVLGGTNALPDRYVKNAILELE